MAKNGAGGPGASLSLCNPRPMPDYQIKIVDVFTTRRYAGNPCGVVTRAEGLTDVQMQAIARELNLSETAFVTPSPASLNGSRSTGARWRL